MTELIFLTMHTLQLSRMHFNTDSQGPLCLEHFSWSYCNWVHLHIVFVLLYSVCRSVSVLSCVDIIESFTYVLRVVILDVTERRGVRESERRYQQPLAYTIKKRKVKKKEEEIKREYLAVARLLLLLPTSNLLLPLTVYIIILIIIIMIWALTEHLSLRWVLSASL